MRFIEKLENAIDKNDSLLCVGLDTDPDRIPDTLKKKKDPVFHFNREIISQTQDLVCSYKINIAFYEALGIKGFEVLKKTIEEIPNDIPVIIDGKRGDIGSTAKMYARAIFEIFNADATTVNPYLGYDSVKPFLDYPDRYVFVLCKTSNPSSSEFQDREVDGKRIYHLVAEKVREWGKNCGAVVGATFPETVYEIRKIIGDDRIMLIPGIGKQGGDLEKTIRYGCTNGRNVIINVSRSIIYAQGKFPSCVRESAERYRYEINSYRC